MNNKLTYDNRSFAVQLREKEKSFASVEVTFRDADGKRTHSLLIPSKYAIFNRFIDLAREFADEELSDVVMSQDALDRAVKTLRIL